MSKPHSRLPTLPPVVCSAFACSAFLYPFDLFKELRRGNPGSGMPMSALISAFRERHGIRGFFTQGIAPEVARASWMRALKFFMFALTLRLRSDPTWQMKRRSQNDPRQYRKPTRVGPDLERAAASIRPLATRMPPAEPASSSSTDAENVAIAATAPKKELVEVASAAPPKKESATPPKARAAPKPQSSKTAPAKTVPPARMAPNPKTAPDPSAVAAAKAVTAKSQPGKAAPKATSAAAPRAAAPKTLAPNPSSDDLLTRNRAMVAEAQTPLSTDQLREEQRAATKARIKAEREEARRHELEMEEKIKRQGPKVVEDILHSPKEQAARVAIAMESRAQRQAQEEERRRQNAEMRRKIREVQPATVDEIDRQAAAEIRVKWAADSKQRQEAENAEKRKWAAHLKERVAAATDEDGNDEEKEKFRALLEDHQLSRPSTTPESTLRIFRSYKKAKEVGDIVRQSKDDWREEKQGMEIAHVTRGQDRWEKRRAQQRTVNRLQKEILQERLDQGAQLKAEKKKGMKQREKEIFKLLKKTKERYIVARGQDSRQDAIEEATAAQLRIEGSQMRDELERSVQERREGELAARKEQATTIREASRQALAAMREQVAQEQAHRGQVTREEARQGRAIREAVDDEYMEGALSNKARSAAIRAAIRAKSMAVARRKKAQADSVREMVADSMDFGSHFQGMSKKKQEVRDVYAQRYGNEIEAADWEGSPLQKLQKWSLWAINGLGQALPSWKEEAKVVSHHQKGGGSSEPPEKEGALQYLLRTSKK